MFDFSSTPENSLQILQDARRAKPGGGPGVPEVPLDEQSAYELKCSLAYTYSVAQVARNEYGDDVAALAKAEFDAVWMALIEVDAEFRKLVIAGKARPPIGPIKPYQDFARGKTSEL
jgi:hypothetical protein